MRRFLVILAFPVLMASCAKPEPKPLNILMIAIDDMNNWIGVMQDKAETPNIDALARSGVLFDNAYCVVPGCNASRTSLMTGLRPETTGQYGNGGNFRERPGGADLLTMPQYFRQHGYEAVAAGKIFHYSRGGGEKPSALSDPASWNYQRKGSIGTPGLDIYQDEEGRATWMEGGWKQYIEDPDARDGKNYFSKQGVWGPVPFTKEETGDWQTAEFCADYLSRDHEKPFFLACGIFRPHMPLLAPQEYFDRYPLESVELPEAPGNDLDDVPEIARTNASTYFVKLMREKGEWKKAVQAYLAGMSFADDCVGHVMEALGNSKYAENTIVVFWTDHGWHLGDKDKWEKFTLWHQSTNAPLIIRYPGMKKSGKVCSGNVSLLDLYPTIIDLAGLPPREILQGENLRPWLDDPSLGKETPAIITQPKGSHSVVWGTWNYIHRGDGSEELYNHDEDPMEFTNLAGVPEHRELMDHLKEWIRITPYTHR